MPNVDGGSLWELVEQRAAATPDALAAVDEDGRTLTWARGQDRGRAGRRRARPARDRRRRRRVVAAARRGSRARSSCSPWPASVPSRTRCCRSTASARSASSPARPRASCSSCRPRGRASTSRRWPRASRRPSPTEGGGPLEVLVADKALPQGDPSTLPPPPDPSDDAVRWYFYTSGTTADPKGAQHTDSTIKASAVGHVRAARDHRRRRERGGVPVHPHRRHRLAVQRPRVRLPHRRTSSGSTRPRRSR